MTNGRRLSKPTAIGQDSFLTWKVCTATPFKVDPVRPNDVLPGRAFSIWTGWARQSSPESQVWQLLESIKDICWLVDVIRHDLKVPKVQFHDDRLAASSGPNIFK
jgi:hypothetical protein